LVAVIAGDDNGGVTPGSAVAAKCDAAKAAEHTYEGATRMARISLGGALLHTARATDHGVFLLLHILKQADFQRGVHWLDQRLTQVSLQAPFAIANSVPGFTLALPLRRRCEQGVCRQVAPRTRAPVSLKAVRHLPEPDKLVLKRAVSPAPPETPCRDLH